MATPASSRKERQWQQRQGGFERQVCHAPQSAAVFQHGKRAYPSERTRTSPSRVGAAPPESCSGKGRQFEGLSAGTTPPWAPIRREQRKAKLHNVSRKKSDFFICPSAPPPKCWPKPEWLAAQNIQEGGTWERIATHLLLLGIAAAAAEVLLHVAHKGIGRALAGVLLDLLAVPEELCRPNVNSASLSLGGADNDMLLVAGREQMCSKARQWTKEEDLCLQSQ